MVALLLAPLLRADEGAEFYEKNVQPILKAHCLQCHGAEAKVKGGLNLTSRDAALKGGDTGPAFSTDKPADSLLLKAVRYAEDDLQMPPKGKLPQRQIDTLNKWVSMGAPYAATKAVVHTGPPKVTDEAKQFWSFRKVEKPTVPPVKAATPIDAFVQAKLDAKGLKPVGPAEPAALLRRITYDLTGLPPTPEQVSAFLADPSQAAYEKVVDRLLASPQYGEKWARAWMDVVRYGDTNSYERDNPKPFIWRYRDYLIESLNACKPFDRMVREQLAGDELYPGDATALIATGFYRLGLWDDEPADPLQARYDDLDDIVGTVGQGFLGLTLNCARCHDHKLDPVPQKDYYRFLSFFQGMNRYGARSNESVADFSLRPINVPLSLEEQADVERKRKDHAHKIAKQDREIQAIESKIVADLVPVEKEEWQYPNTHRDIVKKRIGNQLTAEQFAAYDKAWKEREKLLKNPPKAQAQAMCVTEQREPMKTCVLARGNPRGDGESVEPGFPAVLSPPQPTIRKPDLPSSGRRAALAEWVASKDNPLTARVIANRVWQGHFGRGIVRSANNFGYQGTPPTHPELLDYLASEFMANGWQLKPLHRQIALSDAYRRSSIGDSSNLAADPENDLFWRHDMRRLQAEEVRDTLLSVAGLLNLKMGGPSVYPEMPAEVLAGQSRPGEGWPTSPVAEQNRRSVYVHVKRSLPVPLLYAFDAADADNSCPTRFVSTQPTQALSMLNGKLTNQFAVAFADRVQNAAPDTTGRITAIVSQATQRPATADDVKRGLAFVQKMQGERKLDERRALELYCLLMLNSNEAIYLD